MVNTSEQKTKATTDTMQDEKNKIAIQGVAGCFHHMAAQKFFGKKIDIVPCDNFRELIKKTSTKTETNAGLMAIENSLVGSILPNYNLLQTSKLRVIGEVYLQINQNLMVNRNIKLEDIKEVHSHPMALLQCMNFLEKYKWKLIETEDTALSARFIAQRNSKHIAAIAPKLSAELYNLDIVAPNIHMLKNNYTRFLVLKRSNESDVPAEANKASVNFQTDHSKGSLAKVLSTIADGDINLSKLQSFPIPGSDWKYNFHADMEFNSINKFYQVIEKIKPLTVELNIYGIYKNGKND